VLQKFQGFQELFFSIHGLMYDLNVGLSFFAVKFH